MVVKEAIMLPHNEKLIAVLYLIDSSILHVRETYKDGKLIKYSYHLVKGNKIMRWDNVPHHKEITTYPYHKHEDEKVKVSREMNIDIVLDEIKKRMKL